MGTPILVSEILDPEGREECECSSMGKMVTFHTRNGIIVGHTGKMLTSEDVENILDESPKP